MKVLDEKGTKAIANKIKTLSDPNGSNYEYIFGNTIESNQTWISAQWDLTHERFMLFEIINPHINFHGRLYVQMDNTNRKFELQCLNQATKNLANTYRENMRLVALENGNQTRYAVMIGGMPNYTIIKPIKIPHILNPSRKLSRIITAPMDDISGITLVATPDFVY